MEEKEKELQEMQLTIALEFALNRKDVSKKTRSAYARRLRSIQEASEKLGLSGLRIPAVSRLHVEEIMRRVREDLKLSDPAYNDYLSTLRSLFTTLEGCLVIDRNPAMGIRQMRTMVSTKDLLNEEEKKRITELLYSQHYPFFVYVQVLYHTGIRPKELLDMRIKDVDLEKKVLTVVRTERSFTIVPICEVLLEYLLTLELSNYPGDHYLFGSILPAGKGVGAREYFKPSPTAMTKDTIARLWHKIIQIGMGINKPLYALRKKNDDKQLAPIDVAALRDLYGHRSKYMTETYAKKVAEVYKEDIQASRLRLRGGKS